MTARRFAILVYAVLGTLGVAGGILALINPSIAVPPGTVSPLIWHLVREQGSEGIFIGLMFFWCAWHFEQRRSVHFALLLLTLIFAVIHWTEYFSGRRELLSPVLNSVPFLLLVVTAPWSPTSVPAEAR